MSMAQFAPRRIIETSFLPYPEGSYCLRVNGQMTDVITNGYVPVSPPFTTSPVEGHHDMRNHSLLDSDTDSSSPGASTTYSYDRALFDLRRVPPEKIAAQITLLDLPLFKAITPEELRSCGWTKKDKKERVPNVVAFTHRFNHTSFWVMDEVLNEESLKVRAEIVSQFIRVAKKLHDLNNIHSLKAVIAGLQSAPIYRLSQTWRYVNRKDMNTYTKMVELLSEEDNWKRLREHMDTNKLPCIPYLGILLTDLSFISEVPSKKGQTDSICNTIAYFQNSTYDDLLPEDHIQTFLTRTIVLDELQRVFEDDKFRLSLKYEPIGGSSSDKLRQSKSYEDLLGPFTCDPTQEVDRLTSKPLTPVITANGAILFHRHSYHNIRDRRNTMAGPSSSSQQMSQTETPPILYQAKSPFRSTKSSRNSSQLHVQLAVGNPFEELAGSSPQPKKVSTLPKEFRADQFSAAGAPVHVHGKRTQSESEEKSRRLNPKSLVPWRRKHRKAQSFGGNALSSSFGIQRISPTHSSGEPQSSSRSSLSRSLIGDCDDAFSGGSSFTGSVGNISNNSNFSSTSCESSEVVLIDDLGSCEVSPYDEDEDVHEVYEEHLALTPILEGELKKKLLKKAGKSVSQLKHRKRTCWVQLNQEYLLLLGSKPRPISSSHWRSSKQKLKGFISRLKDCRVKYKDPSEKMNDKQFILVDDSGSHFRFDAKSPAKAMEWVEAIRQAINDEQEREKLRVNQSLIQFNDP